MLLFMAFSQKEQSNNFTWGVAPGYGERGLWPKKVDETRQ